MNLDLFMAEHLRKRLANHFRTQFRGATESTDGKAFTGTGPERGSTPRPSTNPESSSGRTSGSDPANEGSNPSSGSMTDVEWLNATYAMRVFPRRFTREEVLALDAYRSADHTDYCNECGSPLDGD